MLTFSFSSSFIFKVLFLLSQWLWALWMHQRDLIAEIPLNSDCRILCHFPRNANSTNHHNSELSLHCSTQHANNNTWSRLMYIWNKSVKHQQYNTTLYSRFKVLYLSLFIIFIHTMKLTPTYGICDAVRSPFTLVVEFLSLLQHNLCK